MTDFSGLVMAESSRLAPATDRYRNLAGDGGGGGGGSVGPPGDTYMDTQPLDYSKKKSHGGILSLASMASETNQPGDTSARAIFNKAMAMSSMHTESHSSALESGLLPPPGCQPMSTSYSPVSHHHAAYRTPPSAYQQFLPVSPPVPPASHMPPLALPNSPFHNPVTVSSLLLAQLQANPLLFSTLIAKTGLTQQHQLLLQLQQQQQQQEPQKAKTHLSPRLSPKPSDHHRPSSPSSAPLSAFPGLNEGSLDLLHHPAGYSEHLGASPRVLYGTTKEELKLLERSNEEFRNFRETFLTETSKLRLRRGGRRGFYVTPAATAAPATATPASGDTSDSSRGAGDDQASEGGVDVMSVTGGDEDEVNKTENDRSEDDRGPEEDRLETGSETGGLVPYVPRRRVKAGESSVKDQAYWERRRKNNEAAKRSRDARRAKEEEIAIRGAFLEQENMKLRAELSTLKSETAKLRCLLYNS